MRERFLFRHTDSGLLLFDPEILEMFKIDIAHHFFSLILFCICPFHFRKQRKRVTMTEDRPRLGRTAVFVV